MSVTNGGKFSRQRVVTRLALGLATTVAGTSLVVAPVSADTTWGSAAGVPLTRGSMYNVVDQIGARDLWEQGITGAGVNVAIIDTGVAPVPALTGDDKVVAMVDLSDEAASPDLEYVDTYGHGTHMAGIIAGRDPGAVAATAAGRPDWFLGVAPDAGIVSVKVAGRSGAVDVSQVIAGVDWVVEHASELGIGVLNLSYNSGSSLDYRSDPLSLAVERAWRAGIVVVVAAGNDGRNEFRLGMPARNPYVIAVAGAETKNGGWRVPTWATSGDGTRNPDLSAPAASIHSLRSPGSTIDAENPQARVGEFLFKGTGSSQAAAVVAGAAALLLSARPGLTPDQVKSILRSAADDKAIAPREERRSGEGLLSLAGALGAAPTMTAQSWPASVGDGSLDQSRGDQRITMPNGSVLEGEITFNGAKWVGAKWVGAKWVGDSWVGAKWVGAKWVGAKWVGAKWVGAKWVGAKWVGDSWVGAKWIGAKWVGDSWVGATWTGVAWNSVEWT